MRLGAFLCMKARLEPQEGIFVGWQTMLELARSRVAALALALAGCWAGQGDYRPLSVPDEIFAVPQAVFASVLREFPESREGRQELELTVEEQDDGSNVVLLTITGFLDDSVNGEQHRAVLIPDGRGWRVTALGERWRCQGGRGHSGWGTAPCN